MLEKSSPLANTNMNPLPRLTRAKPVADMTSAELQYLTDFCVIRLPAIARHVG
jgi:hypothetical protein